jgi:putative phosphoribosyl transferase
VAFSDRTDAGRRLGQRLVHLRGTDLVVVGLPRGGVPVANEVARALDAPLDVIVVRKLGVPFQPELGMGAIAEGDVRIVNKEVTRLARVSPQALSAVEARERVELDRRAKLFRGDRPRVPLDGKTVIVVDDGLATGSTASAACQVVRRQGAARVVLAVPVAPPETIEKLQKEADEVVCLEIPDWFFAIGAHYANFSQTPDEQVRAILEHATTTATQPPAAKPTTTTTTQPAASPPASPQPAAFQSPKSRPAAAEQATQPPGAQPATAPPAATQQTAAQPQVTQPAAADHDARPPTVQPAAGHPVTARQAAAQPQVTQPTTEPAATAHPAAAEQATTQPPAAQPATAQPATAQPATAQPATGAASSAADPAQHNQHDHDVEITVGGVRLRGQLTVPDPASAVVAFAHGSGSSRHSPRNRFVATVLQRAGLATLLFDLLTPEEEHDRANVFDIGLLAGRLLDATSWLRKEPRTADLPTGYFGASTGAAAALWAAAEPGADIAAVVSRGGRPDLAGPRLAAVQAPTLLIVGSYDHLVLDLNAQAYEKLRCENRLEVVPHATHLFAEPGALEQVAALARDWFTDHLS